jgi:hypothetical protein
VDPRRANQHPGRLVRSFDPLLVIVAWADEDPIAGAGGVDRGLDRLELAFGPVVGADEEHAWRLRRLGGRDRENDERHEECREPDHALTPRHLE